MKRCALASLVFLMLLPAASPADIYRWEDDAGTVHFTDDFSTVPQQYRKKAKMVIREAPRTAEPPPPAPAAQGAGQTPPQPPPPSPGDRAADPAREREELSSQVEQMKAKIAAKERLVQVVEERQNLILNPDRRRVLDPGDLELYKKYQEELPQDRRTLQELENRLESLK